MSKEQEYMKKSGIFVYFIGIVLIAFGIYYVIHSMSFSGSPDPVASWVYDKIDNSDYIYYQANIIFRNTGIQTSEVPSSIEEKYTIAFNRNDATIDGIHTTVKTYQDGYTEESETDSFNISLDDTLTVKILLSSGQENIRRPDTDPELFREIVFGTPLMKFFKTPETTGYKGNETKAYSNRMFPNETLEKKICSLFGTEEPLDEVKVNFQIDMESSEGYECRIYILGSDQMFLNFYRMIYGAEYSNIYIQTETKYSAVEEAIFQSDCNKSER